MSLMLLNVSTRKFGREVRLPAASVPTGSGLSKSAVSRRFKALTEAEFAEWMSSNLSGLDLVVIQIDELHLADDLLMIDAIGVDISGEKHPLGVVEGATENAAVVQALKAAQAFPIDYWDNLQRASHGRGQICSPIDTSAGREVPSSRYRTSTSAVRKSAVSTSSVRRER